MKTIGIVLSIIIYLVTVLSLVSILWVGYLVKHPPILLLIAVGINSLFAGIVANYVSDKFYKWFKSKLKES